MKGRQITEPGPRFNIKMSSYQYRKSHCGDKTILRPSYLHNEISYTGKMTSLYWIKAQFVEESQLYFVYIDVHPAGVLGPILRQVCDLSDSPVCVPRADRANCGRWTGDLLSDLLDGHPLWMSSLHQYHSNYLYTLGVHTDLRQRSMWRVIAKRHGRSVLRN